MVKMAQKWQADTTIKIKIIEKTASAYLQAKKKQMPVDIYPMFHSREQLGSFGQGIGQHLDVLACLQKQS